ncbi:MIF4G-domain-containing protein [Meredithblackwellia eburnea MCA 4105]
MAINLAERELAASEGSVTIKPKIDLKAEMSKLSSTKGGGAYIPPHRLRAMMAEAEQAEDKEGLEYQRLSWEALRKSINGLINKVNVSNIKLIVPELFGENLIRGRGLFVRSLMRAQASSLPFTPIFASLTAIVNSKLPTIGELLISRLVVQFRRSFKRNDKPTMTATTTFLAQLVNQQVAHEVLALQILVLLLEKPTDDSVEIAVSFMREVGLFLAETSPKANNGVFERFRAILHESGIDKRVQYMVEVLFQVRKDKFKDNPVIPEGLDLVEEDDAITHKVMLDGELKVMEMLNVFKFDPEYASNEDKYKEIKTEILGDSDEEDDESGEDADEDDDDESDDEADGTVDVHDQTGTNVVNLRRTIYLTIMSALDFEEAVHKLLKINLGDGQEIEMNNMIVECCSQERTYSKFYGLMGERFCKLNMAWSIAYEECFRTYYDTIHRYETNRLRNIARFFGHLLSTDALPWTVLDVVKMNEDDTTSSSRIFVKILFQEVVEGMGLKKLAERLKEPSLKGYLDNIFPMDNPKNTRFSINFFTSIGLGAVTEEMREQLKRAPALMVRFDVVSQIPNLPDHVYPLFNSFNNAKPWRTPPTPIPLLHSPPRLYPNHQIPSPTLMIAGDEDEDGLEPALTLALALVALTPTLDPAPVRELVQTPTRLGTSVVASPPILLVFEDHLPHGHLPDEAIVFHQSRRLGGGGARPLLPHLRRRRI